MRIRLRHLWEVLTTGYWFVPTMMLLAAAGAAFLLLYIDRTMIGARVGWLYAGGADGAKTMLSTVAGSVITVAGVVFSITIAALTQASSQFGPRLLRNFMRDTANQVVLGTFVGTFIYCLLVLRTIHGKLEDGVEFVPQASVTVAVLLAAASIAVLIYFIHHVSVSLQAPAVVAAVLDDLEDVIARLPNDQEGTGETAAASNALPPEFDAAACPVPSAKQGYVQAVDYNGLIELAEESDLIVRLAYRPGQYVIKGTPLLHAWPAERWAGKDVAARERNVHLWAERDDGAGLGTGAATDGGSRRAGVVAGHQRPVHRDQLHRRPRVRHLRCGASGSPLSRPVRPTWQVADRDAGDDVRRCRGHRVQPDKAVRPGKCGRDDPPAGSDHDLRRASEGRRAAAVPAAARRDVYEDAQEAIPQQRDRDDLRERWEAAVRALGAPLEETH